MNFQLPWVQRSTAPNIRLGITSDHHVVMDFGRNVNKIGLNAEEAESMGKALIEAAERIKQDRRIVIPVD